MQCRKCSYTEQMVHVYNSISVEKKYNTLIGSLPISALFLTWQSRTNMLWRLKQIQPEENLKIKHSLWVFNYPNCVNVVIKWCMNTGRFSFLDLGYVELHFVRHVFIRKRTTKKSLLKMEESAETQCQNGGVCWDNTVFNNFKCKWCIA